MKNLILFSNTYIGILGIRLVWRFDKVLSRILSWTLDTDIDRITSIYNSKVLKVDI